MVKKMNSFPLREGRKLHKIGGGYAVFIPKKWFAAHKLDPDKIDMVLMDADRHIVIVNPKDVETEYKKFSKEVKKKAME